jgi:hypothetical protein
MREIDPMVWVNALIGTFGAEGDVARLHGRPIVIDDLRFPNEYHELRKLGFTIVRVETPVEERVIRLKNNGKLQDERELDDVSETALDAAFAEVRVENTASKEDLSKMVQALIQQEARRRA